MIWRLATMLACGLVWSGAVMAAPPDGDVREQVIATERAFAQSMAARDAQRFSTFVSRDAVFFSGVVPLKGRPAITAAWSKYFEGAQAPFSWEPAEVEVLPSGDLALSSGPVRDPAGKLIGTFTSIWRLEAPHRWRIVFDKGADVCNPQ